MYERDDIDDTDDTIREHPARCGCPACDPDFYFDRAEQSPDRRDDESPGLKGEERRAA